MEVFMKFFKELNSANSEKFMVLAIVLGLISGFLPTLNIISLTIMFFVFVFRIPIGLYFSSWGLFSIIGYFMDHIFHITGLVILKSKILIPIWTNIYNLPLMRWSGFNNSIVMGSLIWGIVLSIIVFILLSKSIKKYRKIMFSFFLSKSYLKWLAPKEEKKGIIRWSGLIGISTIFTLIISFLIIFTDPILKTILEFSLSKSLHKNVAIKQLKTSFSNPSLEIKDLQINHFKIDKIYIKSSWTYLIWKKFDIQKLIIDNIHTEDKITKFLATTEKKKQNHKFNLDIKLPNPKSLLAKQSLQTTKKIQQLKNDYKNLKNVLKDINNNIKSQKDNINSIKTEISLLEKQINNIKDINDVNKILKNINTIKAKINNIQTSIKSEKNKLYSLKNKIKKDLKAIKIAVNQDYNRLSKQYNMLKNQEYLQFANTILKPKIAEYMDKGMKLYSQIKPYIHTKKDIEEPQYIRGKGITIKYKDTVNYPDLLLEYAKINILFKDATFKLIAKNITDNQKITKKNSILDIYSTSNYYKNLTINNSFFIDKLTINTILNNLHTTKLIKNGFELISPNINLNSKLNIYNKIINGNANINIKAKEITYANNKTISSILKNIHQSNFKILIQNNNIDIKSNLDNLLSKALTKIIKNKISKNKTKIKELLNKQVSKELEGVNLKDIDITNIKLNNQENYTKSLTNKLQKYSKDYLSKKILKGNLLNKFHF